MKILILTQNVKDRDGMMQGLQMAKDKCATINLPLEFTFQETTKQFHSIPLNTDVVQNGWEIDPTEIVSETAQTSGTTLLIYDWNFIYPHPTNPCTNSNKGEIPIEIPVQFYTNMVQIPNITYPENLCQFFLHELSHEIAYLTAKPDLTHFQYQSEMHNSSPTDYYLFLIKGLLPYLETQQKITLQRTSDDGIQTMGKITVNDTFLRFTLERPWKDNQKNISCIPKGTYTCRWTFSLRLMKYTYEVLNVPNRSGIRFHKGNYFFDVDGCILLGNGYSDINKDGKTDIINSTLTIQQFETLMAKKDFILEII